MPIATGNQILAADILVRPLLVRKTADETVNNSNVLQNDDELLFAVAANEIWEFTIYVIYDSGATPDFKHNLTGPVASAIYEHDTGLTVAAAAAITVGAAAWIGYGAGSPALGLIIRGIIVNGANAGNLQLQWAQNTADASDTKVKANSCIIAFKLA
jgi:hypothetical protein